MKLALCVPRLSSYPQRPIASIARHSWPTRFYRTTAPYQNLDVFPSQLEDAVTATFLNSRQKTLQRPQTLTEKIVQKYSVGLPPGKIVKSGDYVTIQPHALLTHDNTMPVINKFRSIGASKIKNNRQAVIALDHDVQNKSEANLKKYRLIEEFAKRQEVDFFRAGSGIGHQIMVEKGYAFPGTLVVASDSHSNHYGGCGALGTPVVRTDAVSIWTTQSTWWQVPPVAKVTLTGTLPLGVTGKDVIIALCGLFNQDEVLNHAIEFVGSEETMKSIPIDTRLTIANMTTEWGALSGLFPIDDNLQDWLRYKATESALYESSDLGDNTLIPPRFSHQRIDELFGHPPRADPGAQYAKSLYIDISTLTPYVSGPNSVKIVTPLDELAHQNIKVDKAYLVSCTNSRASDLAAAAKVFRDAAQIDGGAVPRVDPGVTLYVSAASSYEQLAAERAGDWQVLLEAGAIPLPPACNACIGMGTGILEAGEVGISASNRNFKGRMGSRDAKAYLASPEVVAASALHGKIVGPGWYQKPSKWSGVIRGEGDGIKEEDRMITAEQAIQKITDQLDHMIEQGGKEFGAGSEVENDNENKGNLVDILEGFPEQVTGEILYCDADNINTDGIYPGKFTYQDDVTPAKMAEVCMSNYDPRFSSIVKKGDILVTGFNFGCGSSREQAATSLGFAGISLVVAGSFGNTFQRNAINNALKLLNMPQLVKRLREVFSSNRSGATLQKTVVQEPTHNKESLDSQPPPPVALPAKAEGEEVLTRRTGWFLTWDVRRSKVTIQEGPGGSEWSQKVGELPPNVQEIIGVGGLENWIRKEISASP